MLLIPAIDLRNGRCVRLYQGDFAAARACFEESLALRRQIGDLEGIAGSLHCLGLVAVAQGELTSARDQCREGLAVFRQLGDRLGVAESLELLAGLAQKENEPERAARLYGTAEHLRETIGSPVPANEKDLYARSIDLVRASLGARFAALRAEGQGMPLPQAIAYALEETGEPNG